MSGTFHASQIAPDPHGIICGSKQKSAEPSSRRVVWPDARSTPHTSDWSTTYTRRVRPGAVCGAWATRSGPWSVRRRAEVATVSSGWHQRLPSTPVYTIDRSSSAKHQHPPPKPLPTRGAGAATTTSAAGVAIGVGVAIGSSRSKRTSEVPCASPTATTSHRPSADRRGSDSSRPPTHVSIGMVGPRTTRSNVATRVRAPVAPPPARCPIRPVRDVAVHGASRSCDTLDAITPRHEPSRAVTRRHEPSRDDSALAVSAVGRTSRRVGEPFRRAR